MRISDWSSDVCSSDLLMFALVPVTPTWGVADFNVGVLLFLAIAGLEVYAVMLGGWSSNSKYALLGGLRVTAQTVSYEVFMGIALMGIVMIAGRSEEHTSELQSLMRISYAVFCL